MMYPLAHGLPNNGTFHVPGRAYAAPGERQPVLFAPFVQAAGPWFAPAFAAVAAACLVSLFSVML